MKVLIVGAGGREHALAWKCAASPRVTSVLVAPGNAGTAAEAKVRNLNVAAEDVAGLVQLAASEQVDLTIIGPEAPLVAGAVDAFAARGLKCFGPSKAAARLEGSKAFAKEFLRRHRIPTASSATFTRDSFDAAWLRSQRAPLVVKASGLAAGKGVVIAPSIEEARTAAQAMFAGQFGEAGREVVIEEFLPGEEASFIVMADGTHSLPLASSQDHKRRDDGDRGPNTGGMGAYSPAPVVTPALHTRIMREVIDPAIRGLAADGMPYTGFLYAGLMIAADGTPNVLEFNCRCGDPEAQPILMRLQSDLTLLCEAALRGALDTVGAQWDPRAALGVVLAAAGYPDKVGKGDVIEGLERAARLPGKIFHAGTRLEAGKALTNGGRVLCAVGLGASVAEAQRAAYALADTVHWTGVQYRRDIGYRAVQREPPRS
ncbi:MAG: phosphoribosylamine--glycine ligase [Gammaproteobacteria bacterium]|nr:MAG: phosphoribosylamine--glycine ligase [Gammaproteobacteria bacterium]